MYRYKFEYRLSCVDAVLPIEWGVTHSTDMPIWFWGNTDGGTALRDEEKRAISAAIIEPFAKFVHGDGREIGWGARAELGEVRVLGSDGRVRVERDRRWERGMHGWAVLGGVEYDCCARDASML